MSSTSSSRDRSKGSSISCGRQRRHTYLCYRRGRKPLQVYQQHVHQVVPKKSLLGPWRRTRIRNLSRGSWQQALAQRCGSSTCNVWERSGIHSVSRKMEITSFPRLSSASNIRVHKSPLQEHDHIQ